MGEPLMTEIDHLAEELDLELASFDQADAFALGTLLYGKAVALAQGGGVVDIRTASNVLFHAALGGATADNDAWIERKSAAALRFQASTVRIAQTIEGRGDPHASGWLDNTRYALIGGAFPIRVAGAGVVAVVTTSGLGHPDDEHRLLVDTVREFRDSRR
ncbi:heme-binding protein [Cnuibacter physcomitrellae]|uniref:heme-binding protein n=1 Tax=Cnuibacter physcomitrellae TaxID=1619308 RepID=UPI002175E0D8|nr:heme-binding protein [Cnuibacter physcomitrellae]MCS5498364.1 heme-binding protein [Cnuibacter physcomitrellae]